MALVTRDSLLTLEDYAKQRPEFRQRVLAHKQRRKIGIGEHVTLLFEDELTVRYQIQEMLRIEKTFEEAGILEEIAAYNPLIPNGREFKATMLIEYEDASERAIALGKLKDVEHQVWLKIADLPAVVAIADEDLPRSNEEKTSAVHFLRFAITDEMANAFHQGGSIAIGIDHANYQHSVDPVAPMHRDALLLDVRS